jgi:hypothetical protein
MPNLRERFPVYARIVSLYPKAYREQFEEQILQTTADMIDGAQDKREAHMMWLRVLLNTPADIMCQQLKHIGGYMKNTTQKLFTSALWAGLTILATLAFPYVRSVGTTWINAAGLLRVIGLLSFVTIFIALPFVMTGLALFSQPGFLYKKMRG